MLDIRQSQNYANYMSMLGWQVERIAETNYLVKRLPLIGSLVKVQRPAKIDIKVINKLASKYRAFQIIVEPKDVTGAKSLQRWGYKLSKSPYLPTKTLVIDLTRSNKVLFDNLKKDAQSAIRKGRGIIVKEYSTPDEVRIFRNAWRKSVNFKRFVPSSEQLIKLRKSFPHNQSLMLASHNESGSIIGGVIFTRSLHDIVYYWQAFTSNEGRTSLSQYSLVWKGILWGKGQSCKVFDFEGIFDSRFPNTSWLGFSHFKKAFGGKEVIYPGCFIKWRSPFSRAV